MFWRIEVRTNRDIFLLGREESMLESGLPRGPFMSIGGVISGLAELTHDARPVFRAGFLPQIRWRMRDRLDSSLLRTRCPGKNAMLETEACASHLVLSDGRSGWHERSGRRQRSGRHRR
jgi:hypothetical protein